MAPCQTKHHLQAIFEYEYIEGTYDTLNQLLDAHGVRLGLTRKKCNSIRQRKLTTKERYAHIVITDVFPPCP